MIRYSKGIPSKVNPSGVETEIFLGNKTNNMVVDDLAPYVTWASAAMILVLVSAVKDNFITVFYRNQFQLLVLSACSDVVENTNIFPCFLKINLAKKG